MPWAPAHPCTVPGCGELVLAGSRCKRHTRLERREHDAVRGSSAGRGYDARWRAARAAYLQQHPLCAWCADRDVIKAAEVVDHIVPHNGDRQTFWNTDNWQSLCKQCHDRKTTREGRWG